MLYDFNMNSVNVFLSFSDSETTDDEGENQYETKAAIGDDEDQTVHIGMHLLYGSYDLAHFWW